MTTATANPFREGLSTRRSAQPCAVVIFGATGDLTRRKLVPALYNLARENLLPPGSAVVGFARRPKTHDDFRKEMLDAVNQFSRSRPADPRVWEEFAKGLFYVQGEFHDESGYAKLRDFLAGLDRDRATGGRYLSYLSVPPSQMSEILAQLGSSGLSRSAGWSRVIVEKPFGRDLESARALNREILEIFREDQIFRIDHYLGKETVQNLLVMRFANGIFEPLWDRRYVDNVQITVAESIGMEGRGAFYEEAGILRDIVQNHMLQLLCLTAMEPPVAFDANAVRDEKVKVLKAIRRFSREDVGSFVVRGQYAPGIVAGQKVPGYREEPGVSHDSIVETYVAMRLWVDNWRWAGVPFYLRAGKRMPRRVTEIAIEFRAVPHVLFEGMPNANQQNVLAVRVQPDEGISLQFGSKVPGGGIHIQPVLMDFRYGSAFGVEPPEAYERLILDAIIGDSTLFTRHDEVDEAWDVVTRILDAWREGPAPSLPNYVAGEWGPKESDAMLHGEGRRWRRP
jgi:glucose-6-phosphate 1-dehydrogenase